MRNIGRGRRERRYIEAPEVKATRPERKSSSEEYLHGCIFDVDWLISVSGSC
jgi:hypothetical protein